MKSVKFTYRSLVSLISIVVLVLMTTCTDDSAHGPYGSDSTPPGKVIINQVINISLIYFII